MRGYDREHKNLHLYGCWSVFLHRLSAMQSGSSDSTHVELIAPADIKANRNTQPTWKDVRKNFVEYSIKSDTVQDPVYRVGDYVRIRIFKSDKNNPSFTYKKGPLWEIQRKLGRPKQEFNGVYMITGARGGKAGSKVRSLALQSTLYSRDGQRNPRRTSMQRTKNRMEPCHPVLTLHR
eukprot:COSAG03_NODE_9_length_23924_cov_40.675690_8_plen_178_part_00